MFTTVRENVNGDIIVLTVSHFFIVVMLLSAKFLEKNYIDSVLAEMLVFFSMLLYQVNIINSWHKLDMIKDLEGRGCNPQDFGTTKWWFLLEINAFYMAIFTLVLQLLVIELFRFCGVSKMTRKNK